MKFLFPIVFLVFLTAGIPLAARDEGWPQYRGVHGDGLVTEVDLPDFWPEKGPTEVWRIVSGPGYGELVAMNGAIYTNTGDVEGEHKKEYAVCIDAATGKERWRHAVDDLLETEFGHGSRSTPTVDDQRLYLVSGGGNLVALKRKDGSELWRVHFGQAFGSKQPMWGYAGSPLVVGDLLIATVGGAENHFLVAFDKTSGKKVWAALDGSPGYSTPTLADIGETSQLVIGSGAQVHGVDLQGKPLWSLPFGRLLPIAMPTFVAPDLFLFSSTDEGLALMARVVEEGGQFKAEEVWRNQRFKTHFSSSVTQRGRIYGFDVATLKCIDAATGEQQWARRGYGKGSLIMAGEKLLVLTERGKLVMGQPNEKEFQEQARVQALTGRSWTAPVLVGTRLYLRNMSEMVCYDLAQ